MRVLAMAHAYPPHHNGGAEMTLAAQLEHLAARGHTVDVLLNRDPSKAPAGLPYANSSAPGEDYVRNGVSVHLPRNNGDPFTWIGTDRHPDVLVSHLENTTRAAVLADMHDIPMVHILHNTHDFSKHCLRRGRSDLAVFNTQWMADDYAQWFARLGRELPPSVIAHPAVYREEYEVHEVDRPGVKVTLPGKAITLINLYEPKGGALFWELARRMPSRGFLGITGAYGEQVEPENWRADEAYDHVSVWPHMPPAKMRSVYAQTRVLLMPSEYESYGRTAVEAACSGIPTIAHPTPGLVEALGDGGIFCDRDDPDAWVTALRRLWTPKGYAKASRLARAVADRQNPTADLDRVADAIEGLVPHGRLAAAG